ncbi:MAG: hypothetical protein AAF360_12765 [Pseudomonadota bacterium]
MISTAARAAALGGLLIAAGAAQAADPTPLRIAVDGETRRYLMIAPDAAPAPLLVALHGEGGLARSFRKTTRLDAAAARYGWGVAYLQGANNSWNSDPDGAHTPNDRATSSDDRRFIDAVVERLEADGVAALGQVAIVGYGRGGAMAYRYACDRADRILGFAMVAGFAHADAPCAPLTRAGAVIVHGDADPIHPVAGGLIDAQRIPGGRARAASLDVAIAAWTALASATCATERTTPDRRPLAPDGLTLVSIADCGVATYAIEGGGHYWPGGDQVESRAVFGPQPAGFDASKAIAAAFAAMAE